MMKRLLIIISCWVFLGILPIFGGNFRWESNHVLSQLPGNSIGDMETGADSSLWIASGDGIAKTTDFGATWTEFTHDNTAHFPRGSVSALQVRGDTIWVATVFDTTTALGTFPAGGGLSHSVDGGSTWTYIRQPVDGKTDTLLPYGDTSVVLNPTTTNIQNVTYDLAFQDSVVWIACWGGGVRRSLDYGQTFHRIPTPMDNMDALSPESVPPGYEIRLVRGRVNGVDHAGNENQKGFSVEMKGPDVWVGTSGGINHSTDNGRSWKRYYFQNSDISGNWILALKMQETATNTYIWASTGQTFQGQESGISVFDYNTGRWRTAKVVRFANNFAFNPAAGAVYAATDAGIFKTLDEGYTWESFGTIYDAQSHEPVYGASGERGNLYAISVLIGPSPVNTSGRLWVGTTDGLAYTDNEYAWHVLRSFSPTSDPGEADVYLYPNPFSPSRHNRLNGEGHVRIQYDMRASGTVTIQIYDFAMEKVADVVSDQSRSPGPVSDAWDGRNRLGDIVANGVYFCKVIIRENGKTRTRWAKLLVID